jgi:hypothetical protein
MTLLWKYIGLHYLKASAGRVDVGGCVHMAEELFALPYDRMIRLRRCLLYLGSISEGVALQRPTALHDLDIRQY